MTERYELTKSIIHKCPALKLPQTFIEKLGMSAQIVPLRGLTDEQAQAIVDRLNRPDGVALPLKASDGGLPRPGWKSPISATARAYRAGQAEGRERVANVPLTGPKDTHE